jgi:hypothetical protein
MREHCQHIWTDKFGGHTIKVVMPIKPKTVEVIPSSSTSYALALECPEQKNLHDDSHKCQ